MKVGSHNISLPRCADCELINANICLFSFTLPSMWNFIISISFSRHKQDCIFYHTQANMYHETSCNFQAWVEMNTCPPSVYVFVYHFSANRKQDTVYPKTVEQSGIQKQSNSYSTYVLFLQYSEWVRLFFSLEKLIFKFACYFGHLP